MHNSKLIDTQRFVVCCLLGTRRIASVRGACGVLRIYCWGTRRIASVRVSAVYCVRMGLICETVIFPILDVGINIIHDIVE